MKLYTDFTSVPSNLLIPLFEFTSHFQFQNDISNSDYVLLPVPWEVLHDYSNEEYILKGLNPKLRYDIIKKVDRLIDLAQTNNKKIILFYFRDNDDDIKIQDAYIFRTSLYKSNQKNNVFSVPAWNEDFHYNSMNHTIRINTKRRTPRVGFRGMAVPFQMSLKNQLKLGINRSFKNLGIKWQIASAWNHGYLLRKRTIKHLTKNADINTDIFILNTSHLAEQNKKVLEDNKSQFIRNIIENDYNLCIRGNGNYSYRLYETISAGRIPLFVNTDCVLPFDFMIDWKKFVIWVEEKDIDNVDSIVLNYHQTLSEKDFTDLQVEIRNFWEEWISPAGFFKNFHKHFACEDPTFSGKILLNTAPIHPA